LNNWAVVKSSLDSSTSERLEILFKSAMITAESTFPSVKLLRSRFDKIRKCVRESKLSFLSSLPQRFSDLKAQCNKVGNQVYRGFLEESFRCWSSKARRASIVIGWCAVESKLFEIYGKWTIDQIKAFLDDANRRHIRFHDDLTYLSDDSLLTGLRVQSILSSADYRLLTKVCKTYRDLAAHASLQRDIHDDEVSASLRIMIDFLSKPI
jgi:hypothetical protein